MALLLFGCQGPGKAPVEPESFFVPPDEEGPYSAGLTTVEFTDSRGKELVADIWYPAHAEEDGELAQYAPTTLAIGAYRDPPPAVQEAPIVAFSHGFMAIRFQSAYLMEHLARHGYVVVAVDHPGNTFLDPDEDAIFQVLVERPDDLRHAVDELMRISADSTEPLSGVAGGPEYAAIGHSFGTHTALVLAGAQLDYQGFLSHCGEDPSPAACSYVHQFDIDEWEMHGTADDRVSAVLPMSPGLWYFFGSEGGGLSETPPSLVLAGTMDGVLKYTEEAVPVFEAMNSPKRLATFHGAGHYGFSDICLLASFLSDECGGTQDGWQDIGTTQTHSKTLAAAFLGLELRGEERYGDWLDPEAWDGPGLSLEETE
jgi:predicted dienelactone hydrolase